MDMNAFGDWLWTTLQNLSDIAPLATLFAVIVAYISYRGTIEQKTSSDNRNAWWDRVQWAIDAALSDDEQRRATGVAALEQMQDSEHATLADQALLAAMAAAIVDQTLATLDEDSGPAIETHPRTTIKAAEEVNQAMASKEQANEPAADSTPSGKYEVRLASRDGQVVYAKSLTQKRILESAERIIAKANEKAAGQSG